MSFRATLLVLLVVAGCAETPQQLPGCWKNTDIKLGSRVAGTVIIEVNRSTRPLLLPLSCAGGGGPARLPDGFSVTRASQNGRGPSSAGAFFYKAQIEGRATAKHPAGGYEFTLASIKNVESVWPIWLPFRYRDQ